jgi:uncharacterized membrane protein
VARAKRKFDGRAIIASAIILTAGALALAAAGVGPRFTRVSGRGSLAISGASLEKGSIHFFSYRDEAGWDIRFVLGRDQSGQVRGAFDACQRCARYGQGYTSSHGYLVCRVCGNRYRLDSRTGIASCAPIELHVHEAGNSITVDTTELKRQRDLF